jgi:WD40 repeat protein
MWLVPAADGQHVVGFTRWFKEVCTLGGEPLIELKRRPLPEGFDMGYFAVNPTGRYLAVTGNVGPVPVLDIAEPDTQPARLTGHAAEVVAAAFHPDECYLATSSWDGTTRIWDWTARESRLLHEGWNSAIRFSTDGSRCAAVPGDTARKEIVLWEFATPRAMRHWRLEAPKDLGPIRKISSRVTFSADNQWLAVGTGYGVRVLTVPGLELRAVLGTNEVYALRFAPGGIVCSPLVWKATAFGTRSYLRPADHPPPA